MDRNILTDITDVACQNQVIRGFDVYCELKERGFAFVDAMGTLNDHLRDSITYCHDGEYVCTIADTIDYGSALYFADRYGLTLSQLYEWYSGSTRLFVHDMNTAVRSGDPDGYFEDVAVGASCVVTGGVSALMGV